MSGIEQLCAFIMEKYGVDFEMASSVLDQALCDYDAIKAVQKAISEEMEVRG